MRVEIVTIGDELLLGLTVDTNAVWLAQRLAELGVSVARRTTVGDDAAGITAAVGEALARTGAVITTGGLGPTADDRTMPAVAAAFDRPLRFDEALWEALRQRWRARGRRGEPPEANRQQVTVPEGATILRNRHGTAPGALVEDVARGWVAVLPGVPREMYGVFADELEPWLRSRLVAGHVVRTFTLRTTGIAESQLPDLLGEYASGVDGLDLAYLPGQEGVDLRLTARDQPADEADRRLRAAADRLRQRLGRHWYADGSTDLAAVVLERCRAHALRIAVAESCTGGLLGARLTSVSGSSDVMLGGVIAYANEVKVDALGVDPGLLNRVGAVSEEVAQAMASGVRERLRAEVGVGITGVAGPTGGTPDKPVGLVWIAVDVAGSIRTYGGHFVGDRAEIRFRATQAALDMIRRGVRP